jgi:hypothetical protein
MFASFRYKVILYLEKNIMPKLNSIEIEAMKSDYEFNDSKDSESCKNKRTEEIRRRLDEHFEARRMKYEVGDYD